MLRTARTTIALGQWQAGPEAIALYELGGAMPAAILASALLARFFAITRYPMLFAYCAGLLICFYMVFSFFLYPCAALLPYPAAQLATLLFYGMVELWKTVLISILLWGWLNRHLSWKQAQGVYPLLTLGYSLGNILAAPLIHLCNYAAAWQQSLQLLIMAVGCIGVCAIALFFYLCRIAKGRQIAGGQGAALLRKKHSLTSCLASSLSNQHLRLIAVMTAADYLAYTFGELLFLGVLKQYFPSPQDYCSALGYLALATGIMTAITALGIAPKLMQKGSWWAVAAATPLTLLISQAFFFSAAIAYQLGIAVPLPIVMLLGSIQYVGGAAFKMTLFQPAKEMAFIPLPESLQQQGKIGIDGMGTRLARGSAALVGALCTVGLGPYAVLAMAPIALTANSLWLWSTRELRKCAKTQVNKLGDSGL